MDQQLKRGGQKERGTTQRMNWLSKLSPEERTAHMKKIRKNRKVHNQWVTNRTQEEVNAQMQKVRESKRGAKRQS